ncbi:SsrA-binding protein SmpB [Psychrobium sp. 1_MG-2023]|uniref:SsrA-binding protein SmpB n=1 Tax=Psychrobium sp. 1_MG-2023 TaxID=3062624 RepID=UPI000C31C519|nr:SsrA-binding protein SmpB [Psychrobium sp. 1_MG-2023]MDP2561277.1 SsrA-binding protein SmpB [Psychrobium sp. 1_MG-2023]PKF55223.1 SsrA-binding protein [Alteromonadales bacterium alter-6D02]
MAKHKGKKPGGGNIAKNRKATHEYKISEKTEGGLELQGWEVKAMRIGKVNLSDAYVIIQNGQALLLGCHITPLNTASTHVHCDPERPRRLLLNRREIDKLQGLVERQGFAIIALNLYWKGPWAKVEIGLGKGKQEHDKREDGKSRDWEREKSRVMKDSLR